MVLRRLKNLLFESEKSLFKSKLSSAQVAFLLLLVCAGVCILSFWSAGYCLSAKTSLSELVKPEQTDPNSVVAETETADSDIVKSVCELIYQGKFEAADELLKQSESADSGEKPAGRPGRGSGQDQTPLRQAQLAQIIQEYKKVNQHRQSTRQAAYEEQLKELEKYRDRMDTVDTNNIADTNDVNDVNDIYVGLSIITNVSEFADKQQNKKLLTEPLIKKFFQRAIDKAAELDSRGKWLEAYINCYYWLLMIDPNNKAYSDYADELLDKASILASLQDSPCETRQERYQGVKKEIFLRAIDALNLHYVSVIDYGQMAVKALNRCDLLADVIKTSFFGSEQSSNEISFTPPSHKELIAWSAGLAALLDDVEHSTSGFNKDKFIELFEKTLALNIATVEFPQSILIMHFAEAALSALDPYTVLVWPKQVRDFEKVMTKEFTGIGIEISRPKGLLTVSSLLPDTPAYRAGLDAGDVIEAVDGVPTKDMSLICAVWKITGPKGTKVTLTIRRPGEEQTKEITIIRDRIIVPTIRGWKRDESGQWLYMIDEQDKIGYVQITDFVATTADDLEQALKELEKDGLNGLILDLRFNAGGFLNSAVDVADNFLETGLIVKTQPGFGRIPIYEPAHAKGTHPNYPLVIIINSGTASGSEIVAGALADSEHNRAILVGNRTHGKGLVQGRIHLSDGDAQLKYTMAYYHLPSGQRVKSREETEKQGKTDWGIGPEVEIELRSDELKRMLDVQRANDVLVQASRHEGDSTLKKYTIQETLQADPQLAVAVLIIKTKLIEQGTFSSE